MTPSPLISLAAALLLAATVRADWTAPSDFTNGPSYEVGPRGVRDTNGNIHLVWYGGAEDSSDWKVWYQTWTAATGWTAPVSISASPAASPDIAIDGANNLHVVWHGGGNPEDVHYRKATAGVWGATTNLSNSGHRSLNPRLAVNVAGTALLVGWHESEQTGGNWDILARPFASGVWQPIENASNDGGLSRTVDVKADAAGNFHLGWEDLDTKNAYYRKRTAGVYGAKTALDTTSGRSLAVSLAIAPNGHIHAAWHNDDGDWEIFHRRFDGAGWGAITNVSNRPDPDHADNTAILLVDAANNAHLVWHDYQRVYYAHTVAGAWRPHYALYSGASAGSPQLVLGQTTGQLHCIFASRDPGTWDCFQTVRAIPDITPPGAVTNFRVTPSTGQNRLDWNTPSALDRAGVRIRWKTTGFPTSATDGTLLADVAVPGFTINHTGLANGTTYYYSAFAYDTEPNFSAAAQASGTPTSAPKPNLLTNGAIELFSAGTATGWTTYKVNDPNNAITFSSDNTNVQSSSPNPSTLSQRIAGLDAASLPASGFSAAGVRQSVPSTPGKVYLLVGYQDLHTSDFGADGDRYVHDFGINVTGDTAPGAPTFTGRIGGAKWLTPAQALHNNNGGGSPKFSGMHRARAAFVAQASTISVWSGVCIKNDGPRDNVAAKFNVDAHYLFAFDFPVEPTLRNAGFEGAILDLQNDGDSLPDRWLPAGGGIGTSQTWACGTFWKRSGVNGVRVWSRRGTVNAGLMQRVAAVPGSSYTFSVYGATSGQDAATMSVGIDPAGGGDLTSPSIVWSAGSTASNAGGPPNTLLSVTAMAQSSAITVFLRTTSTNATGTSNYQWSDFDDAQLAGSAGGAVFIARGATWRYHDADVDIGRAWRGSDFDDSAWADGPAELGFGDAPATPINDNGGTPRPMSARFRHTFPVADPAIYSALNLAVQRDDGAVIYLNGLEIWRTNMFPGEVAHGTPAGAGITGADENTFFTATIEPGLLVAGTNVLAVEVHQNLDTSSDLSFDLELTAAIGDADTDHDGLPDAWEMQTFGNVAQNGGGDADGDGATNAAERVARTHPADGGSFFIAHAERLANGHVVLAWPSHAGLIYRIRFTEDLANWTTLNTVFTGTGGTLAWTDDGLETGSPPSSEAQRIYQVMTGP